MKNEYNFQELQISLSDLENNQKLKSKLEKWAKKNQKIIIATSKKVIVVCASTMVISSSFVSDAKLDKESKETYLTSGIYYENDNKLNTDIINEEIITNNNFKNNVLNEVEEQELNNILDGHFEELTRIYYNIPNCDNKLQDFIYETSDKYNVPSKVVFTIIETLASGNLDQDGKNLNGNYGITGINKCNFEFISKNYGYTEKQVRLDTYVNVECCIRMLSDNFIPASEYDQEQLNYEEIFGTYNGWTNWKNNKDCVNYVNNAMDIFNNKYNKVINDKKTIDIKLNDVIKDENIEETKKGIIYTENMGIVGSKTEENNQVNEVVKDKELEKARNILKEEQIEKASNINVDKEENNEVVKEEQDKKVTNINVIKGANGKETKEVQVISNLSKNFSYYDIPIYDHKFQDFIFETSAKYNVPADLVFTFLDIESGGTWATNGVISKTNDYGLSQINRMNLDYIKTRYGYDADQVLNDPYINVECCIRLLSDNFLPAAHFDKNTNPNYEEVFGVYNGWVAWRSKPGSNAYVKKALNIMNSKYNHNVEYKPVAEKNELNEVTQEITNENIHPQEKYYIRLYSDAYGLDYVTVYNIISKMTDSFTNEAYQNNKIGESKLNNRIIYCNSKEMAILLTIHNIYLNPKQFNYSYSGSIPAPTYMLSNDYFNQISYISNVLDIEDELIYSICQVTYGFDNPMTLVNKNPGGIKIDGNYANFPTITAGFIEVTFKLLEAKMDCVTNINDLSVYFEQSNNTDWANLVEYFYKSYQESPELLLSRKK